METEFKWQLDCGLELQVTATGTPETDFGSTTVDNLVVEYEPLNVITPLAARELVEAEDAIETYAIQRLCDSRGAA